MDEKRLQYIKNENNVITGISFESADWLIETVEELLEYKKAFEASKKAGVNLPHIKR